jgi:hypothetical protein
VTPALVESDVYPQVGVVAPDVLAHPENHARLRYSSEGGYLCPGVMFRAFGNLPRPESWLPYVFTSIDDFALDEIVGQNRS